MTRQSEAQLRQILKLLCQKYDVDDGELKALMEQAEPRIPATAFDSGLAPMEVVVTYLRSKGLRLVDIAALLGRDQREIGVASRRAQSRPQQPPPAPTRHLIPVRLFADRSLSVLEHVVVHLRSKGLRFSEIADLLGKDDRTIWTAHSRAQRKDLNKLKIKK